MTDQIENSVLQVAVKRLGAELCSIRSASGIEYMWQADPAFWPRHAPLLFPIVGALAANQYRYSGQTYSLTRHGFARDHDFELVSSTAEALHYRLVDTDATYAVYPFHFALYVHYRIEAQTLSVIYEVHNEDDKTMPFSIGGHPAFSCGWQPGDRLEDYYLEFDKPETTAPFLLQDGTLLSKEQAAVLIDPKTLRLSADLFVRDALIFTDLASECLTLCCDRHRNRLRVAFPHFPYLGIWSRPGAPYVCIEPWFGHPDPIGVNGDILQKPGIQKLESGAAFTCTTQIGVEE